jgi:tetratricopeptide (TPR) repeat protein
MTNEQAQELLGEIAGYLETLRKDPHSAIFVPLSDAYRKLGMLEEALSTALHGVEALPFFGPGYVVLGRTQMKYGELGRACQSFHKALEVDPASIAALKNLAKLYVLQGDRDHASSFLARAVELSPDDLVLANLYKSLRPAVVETDLPVTDEDGISSDCASQPHFATATVADLYVQQGHLDKARNIYRELLEAQPEDQSVRERLAHVEALLTEKSPLSGDGVASETRYSVGEDEVPDAPRDVVGTLRNWLSAIQARREHVQKHFAGHC